MCKKMILPRSFIRYFRFSIMLFWIGVSACSNDSDDATLPKANVELEWIKESEEHPEGLLIAKLEDVEFRVPWKTYMPRPAEAHEFGGFDLNMVWNSDSKKLTPGMTWNGENRFRVYVQFRGRAIPSRDYEENINLDYSKLPEANYPDQSHYVFQSSKEYPDIQEYYLYKQKKAFQFFIEYTYLPSDQHIKERISCIPGFREDEKMDLYKIYNPNCGFGRAFSPHTYVSVTFDSRILPQARVFHQEIVKLISSFTSAKHY